MAHFFTIPDFDIQTRGFSPRCQLCGSPKASKDSVVFRGPMIEHEGYFDICANCVREMAARLGLVTKERHDVARKENQRLRRENDSLREKLQDVANFALETVSQT